MYAATAAGLRQADGPGREAAERVLADHRGEGGRVCGPARCGRRFGLAWYAMEVIAAGGPRHDLAGFGTKRALSTPRQADLMIVAGRVSQKMTPLLRQIYNQMG